MSKLTELVEAAKAATPGTWEWTNAGSSDFVISGPDRLAIGYLDSHRTSKYVVLANPATILELCALLEKAEEALEEAEGATAYSSHEDSVGYRICCQVASYKPHLKGCVLNNALSAIKQWKEQS